MLKQLLDTCDRVFSIWQVSISISYMYPCFKRRSRASRRYFCIRISFRVLFVNAFRVVSYIPVYRDSCWSPSGRCMTVLFQTFFCVDRPLGKQKLRIVRRLVPLVFTVDVIPYLVIGVARASIVYFSRILICIKNDAWSIRFGEINYWSISEITVSRTVAEVRPP